MARLLFICFTYTFCVACGGAPTTPSPSPTPTWTLTGQIVDSLTTRAISQARLLGVATDAAGVFTTTGQGSRTSLRATIEAEGYLTRETTINSTTTAPVLDLIPTIAAPLYTQLARNGLEAPAALEPIRRWVSAPSVYIEQDGRLSAEDLRRLRVGVTAAIAQMSPFGSVPIEVGPPRADQNGWITIRFIADNSVVGCGASMVGANPGVVTMNLKPLCTTFCPGIIPGAVAHEIGHALGFWHDDQGVMTTQTNAAKCLEPVTFTESERQAAALVYKRPPGNRAPDVDPN